jgi:hypothetical protein
MFDVGVDYNHAYSEQPLSVISKTVLHVLPFSRKVSDDRFNRCILGTMERTSSSPSDKSLCNVSKKNGEGKNERPELQTALYLLPNVDVHSIQPVSEVALQDAWRWRRNLQGSVGFRRSVRLRDELLEATTMTISRRRSEQTRCTFLSFNMR